MANYNVDIDVAVRGYNRVEQNLKKLDQLIGKPRTFEISPFINVRKFRREQQKLLKELRRTGVESAVAFQEAFEREMARNRRISSMTAGAGSRMLPAAAGPIALLPATAVGQFQRAANAAKVIDASFANAKRSIDSITNRLALPAGGGGIAGLLPPSGGTGGGGGGNIVPFGSGEFPFRGGRGGFRFAPDVTPGRNRGLFSRIDQNRRSAALTGGAFPLLFGGGFGQAAGGAIGGLYSGKLFGGLTVALQVAGMAVDSMVNSTIAFSSSLGETDTALQSMTERSLFSTKATQRRAEELQALGKTEELANLLTAELASTIGTEGVKAFKDLGDESSEFNILVNKLFISLQALVAGPLAGFLSLVNSVLGRDISEQTIRSLRESLQTPEGVAAFDKRVKELVGTETITRTLGQGEFETKEVLKTASLEQLGVLRQENIEGKFGETNLLANLIEQSKPPIKKPRPTKERESRAPQLQIELGLTERLNVLNRQILKAKQDEDPVREAALKREIALEEQAASIKEINLQKIPANEKDLEIKKLKLQTDQEIFEINHRLSVLKADQAEKNQKIIADLEGQGKLLQAQLDGRLEEEEIAQELAKLGRENKDLDLEKVRSILEANNALQKQVEIAEAIKGFYEQIGATIQSGIVDGIMSAVEGSKSLSESLAGVLRQLGGMFLNVGIGALGQQMGIPGFKPFAQGGYVSGPTPALIGEGGQGEYVIPENKMRESMARYSRGARGSAVIPETGASGTSSGGGGAAVAAPIDVRFNVERINNVDYVTAEQFQAGMRQAANQGAKQGEQQTLKRLQMSGSTRKRLGM